MISWHTLLHKFRQKEEQEILRFKELKRPTKRKQDQAPTDLLNENKKKRKLAETLSKNISKTKVILLKAGKKNRPQPKSPLQNLAKTKLKHKLDWTQMGVRHPRNPPQSTSPLRLRWKRKQKPVQAGNRSS